MEGISLYLNFLKTNGWPVSKINPGSNEIALNVDDALKALDLLRKANSAVLGGDILSKQENTLAYAYQFWGEEYQYLNWYCEKLGDETEDDYLKRSFQLASENIADAKKIAELFKMPCYIVLIT